MARPVTPVPLRGILMFIRGLRPSSKEITPVRHPLLFALLLVSTGLSAFTYEGPDTVVALTRGSGHYEVSLLDGENPEGPWRLIVTRKYIYLLDQINKRVVYYDSSGHFQGEIETSFKSSDIAVDSLGFVYALDNQIQPARVSIFEGGREVSQMVVEYEKENPINNLFFFTEGRLLFSLRDGAYEALPKKNEGQFTGSYYLQASDYINFGVEEICADGLEESSTTVKQEILRKEGSSIAFLASDSLILFLDGVETETHNIRTGISYTRSIVVQAGVPYQFMRNIAYLENLPSNHYSYLTCRRNVSIDPQGNIYMFTSNDDGKAAILRWRAVP